jgi:hypothetical protein
MTLVNSLLLFLCTTSIYCPLGAERSQLKLPIDLPHFYEGHSACCLYVVIDGRRTGPRNRVRSSDHR